MSRSMIVVPLFLFLCSAASAEDVAVLEYRGRCLQPGEFNPLTVCFSLAAADTNKSLHDRLPFLEATDSTVLVEIVDAVPEKPERLVPIPHLSLRPFRLELDTSASPRVVFYAEPFFFETVETFSAAARGVTEATLRIRLAGLGVPDWLFDGLTLWALAETDATDLPAYGWDLPDDAFTRGLDSRWLATDRFRDRMMIRYLVELSGADAPDRLAKLLEDGQPLSAAIEAVAECSLAEFEKRGLEFVGERVQSRHTEEAAPLLDGYAALRAGDCEEAARQAERMMGSPAEYLHPHALLLAGKALNAMRHPEIAVKPLEHFFHLVPHETDFKNVLIGEEPPDVGLLMGPIHLELGRCRRAMREPARAAAAYAKILSSYPEGELLADALLEQALCEAERGAPAEAAALATLWLASFPDHPRRPQAAELIETAEDD